MKNLIPEQYIGKKIKGISIDDQTLIIQLQGATLVFEDTGQCCCESRYMTCDDDLEYYIGCKLLKAEIREAPEVEEPNGDCHDQEFLLITTSNSVFTVANHNEHNGYYGGFDIEVKVI